MPKRGKAGPPYTDLPKEAYVVVTNPWGMNSNPRKRGSGDFDRIASWAQFALQQTGPGGRIPTIECVYGMGTHDEVILQFSEGTDVIPLLGEHRWANFAKHRLDPNDLRATCVFIYNWRNNGDPANHNWTENYPTNLPLNTVPARSPYPAPSWTSPPSTLTNLVHSIPRPPIPPPMPDDRHNQGQEQQSVTSPPPSTETATPAPQQREHKSGSAVQNLEQDSAYQSANLFTPYEPPAQHPSHARFLNHSQTWRDEAPSSQVSPPSPKFIKKLDPYELDEDALNVIHASDPKQEDVSEVKNEDIKSIVHLSIKAEIPDIKTEDDDAQRNITSESDSRYQPSQALINAFNSLRQVEQIPSSARPQIRDPRRRRDMASPVVPPASSGYQPSAALEVEINALLHSRTSAASSTLSNARSTSGTRGVFSLFDMQMCSDDERGSSTVVVKRGYEDNAASSLGIQGRERKKIKIEEC